MAPEAKNTAFIASFISRSVPSSSPKEHTSSGADGDLAALCKHLVNAAGPAAVDQLYGKEIRSQVDEWLSFASVGQANQDQVSVSARLKTLDSYLLTRAVMLGGGLSIGLADIALFVSIHDEVAALSKEERSSYPNLLRWIDYVQNKDDKSHAYEWISVVKPKFDPPVSADSVSKKVVSSAQGPSGKEKTSTGTAAITPGQQKSATKEGSGRPDPLPDKKVVSQADGTKVNQKEKKGKPEALSAGKAGAEDTAKTVHKEKKEPNPAQKDDFGLEILDIKVGVIKTVKKHPTAETIYSVVILGAICKKADLVREPILRTHSPCHYVKRSNKYVQRLYVEAIDVGEGSLRQVVSGLAKFLTEDEMLNRRVLVLANVKPSKLRDVLSSGLVLCTSNGDHSQCEPVVPPKEAKIGARVTAEGYEGKPEAVLNPKKKQWDKIYPHLHTNDAGVACYKGIPLTTSAGPCTASIIKGTIK